MKQYNKILEAINRGIKFALDDFDNDDLIGQQTQTIKDKNITKDYLDLIENFVDLDLPSGIWWAKYNLGVNQENLQYSNSWYGKSFAWGEITIKKIYNWFTYKYCDDSLTSLTKYCPRGEKYNWVWNWSDSNIKRIPPDGKCILELSDDAANITNNKWRIPSEKDFKELLEYTTGKQIKDYNNIIGLNGWEFTSKINSEKIFFPIILGHNQLRAYYWTNSIYKKKPFEANAFYIDDFIEPRITSTNRCFDCFIRPITKLQL